MHSPSSPVSHSSFMPVGPSGANHIPNASSGKDGCHYVCLCSCVVSLSNNGDCKEYTGEWILTFGCLNHLWKRLGYPRACRFFLFDKHTIVTFRPFWIVPLILVGNTQTFHCPPILASWLNKSQLSYWSGKEEKKLSHNWGLIKRRSTCDWSWEVLSWLVALSHVEMWLLMC